MEIMTGLKAGAPVRHHSSLDTVVPRKETVPCCLCVLSSLSSLLTCFIVVSKSGGTVPSLKSFPSAQLKPRTSIGFKKCLLFPRASGFELGEHLSELLTKLICPCFKLWLTVREKSCPLLVCLVSRKPCFVFSLKGASSCSSPGTLGLPPTELQITG